MPQHATAPPARSTHVSAPAAAAETTEALKPVTATGAGEHPTLTSVHDCGPVLLPPMPSSPA